MALEVDKLSLSFGPRQILNELSFSVPAGQSIALLGENGAGKSSLLQVLAGQLRARSGKIQIHGLPGKSLTARRQLAYAPQFLDFPAGLKIREIMHFVMKLYNSSAEQLQRVSADFGLAELEPRPADRLSGGEAKRVSLALAFASNASVLLLDEPAAALDQHYQRTLTHYLEQLKGRSTILFVSHERPASLSLADRLLYLDQGRLSEDISQSRPHEISKLSFFASECPTLKGVVQQQRSGDYWELSSFDGDALVRQLVSSGVPFSHLSLSREALD